MLHGGMTSPIVSAECAVLTLRDVVASHARRAPSAPALITATRELTFGELVASASALDAILAARGVTTGQHLAIIGATDADLAIALLGASHRAACLPLAPSLAQEELGALLDAAQITTILCVGDLPARVTQLASRSGRACLWARANARDLTWSVEGSPASGVQTRGLSLIMPTSGSSGRQKLVPIDHKAVVHGARTIARALELTHDDRCLNLFPMFHVSGQFVAVFSSWVAGAAAICVDDAAHPELLARYRKYAPSWLCAVPTALSRIAREQATDARALGLSFVHSGAAPLSPKDHTAIESAFGAPVIQSYGMTETLMIACNPRPPRLRKPGSVGFLQQDARIVDANGSRLPQGQHGEIAVAGDSVMPGYLGMSNDDVFVGRHLRTGDVGFLDDEGYLHITGRAKEMINRGGEKVFPVEVDAVLEQHPEVQEATSFGFAHPVLGEDVAACVVLKPGCQVSEQTLRTFAAERLSPHKVPRRILMVRELPQTSTGKRLRTGLAERFARELEGSREASHALLDLSGMGADEARKACLELIQQELRDLLARDHLESSETFTDAGLDSAGLAELRARLSAALGTPISQSALFEHCTADRLASHLAAAHGRSPTGSELLGPVERPLSPTELNWVRALERTGSGVLFEGVHLRGRFDPFALQAAIADVAACHPLLQVRIEGKGRRRAFVRTARLPQVHERQIAYAEIAQEVEQQLARKDFVEDAPLLEIQVLRLSDRADEYVLGLRAHHAIWDGGNLVLRELLGAYAARLGGGSSDLRPRASLKSVDELAARSRGKRSRLGAKARYLGDLLAQDLIPVTDIGSPRRTRLSSFTLGAQDLAGLKATAAAENVSWSTLVAGSYVHAVGRHLGGDAARQVSLMSFVDVRNHYTPPVEPGSLGYCVSAILQSLRVAPSTSALEVSQACATNFTSALAQGLAIDLHGMSSALFRAAIDWPALTPRGGRTTTLSFSMVDTFSALQPTLPGLTVLDVVAGASMHGVGPCICLMVIPVFDELRCLLLYPEPLLDPAFVDAVSATFRTSLQAFGAGPGGVATARVRTRKGGSRDVRQPAHAPIS